MWVLDIKTTWAAIDREMSLYMNKLHFELSEVRRLHVF